MYGSAELLIEEQQFRWHL